MNKIALITGASRGLGRNGALALARRGVDLVITYRDAEAAQQVAEEIRALGRKVLTLPLDMAQSSTFHDFSVRLAEGLAQQWKTEQFDFLVNNAGFGVHAGYAETTEADFDALVAVHLKGPYFLTQTLLSMIRDGGRILNVSSGLTRFSLPGYSAYASMKGAVEVLSRYQARELSARGIRVNTLAPGAIETDFGSGLVRDNAAVNKMIADQTALGRVGVPDDIGNMIAALLQEETGWMTGQRVEASGGMYL